MQNADQADLRSEVSRIGRHLQQGLGAGTEQKVIEQALVVQCQHIEFVGHGEHDMEVVGGEQVAFPRCEPAFAGLCLALRTVPVAAGVVGDGGLVTAPGTSIDVTAQRRRAAAWNGPESFELLKVEAFSYLSRKRFPCARRMSATSTAGRLIFVSFGDTNGPRNRR